VLNRRGVRIIRKASIFRLKYEYAALNRPNSREEWKRSCLDELAGEILLSLTSPTMFTQPEKTELWWSIEAGLSANDGLSYDNSKT